MMASAKRFLVSRRLRRAAGLTNARVRSKKIKSTDPAQLRIDPSTFTQYKGYLPGKGEVLAVVSDPNKWTNKFIVYGLRYKKDLRIYYIGRSESILKRYSRHFGGSGKQLVHYWMRHVGIENVEMVVLWHKNPRKDDYDNQSARLREEEISRINEHFDDLLNETNGSGLETEELKARRQASVDEANKRPDVKRRRRLAGKEAQNRPEVKAVVAAASEKTWRKPGHREKMVAIQTEAQNRPEVRAKREAAWKKMLKRPGEKKRIFQDKWEDPQVCYNHKKGIAEANKRPEVLANRRAAAKKSANIPEIRARRIAGINTPEAKAKKSASLHRASMERLSKRRYPKSGKPMRLKDFRLVSSRDREVICARYGMGKYKDQGVKTLEEVGALLGYAKTSVKAFLTRSLKSIEIQLGYI